MAAEQNAQDYGGTVDKGLLALQSVSGATDWPVEGERSGGASAEPQARGGSPRRRNRWIWQALLLLFLLAVAGAAGGLYYLDRQFAGKIYPNISVRGIAIGQMTQAEAQAAIRERYQPFLKQPVKLTYRDKVWYPSLEELGTQLDIDGAVQKALDSGRGNSLFTNLWEVAAIWQRGIELPLHLTVDQSVMQRYLAARAAEVERPASDARLLFEGTTLGSVPSSTGTQLLLNDTTLDLTAALQALEPQEVSLRSRELSPALSDAAVAQAQRTIQQMLQGPVAVTADGETFTLEVADIAALVRVNRVAGGEQSDTLSVSLDDGPIKARLTEIADATGRAPTHPRVAWNGGNLKITRPGKPGLRLDESASLGLITSAIQGSNRAVDLPFIEVDSPANEATLGQLGIKELISVGRSDYSGSAAYRITNIGVGMQKLDGILLAPGEEFSFNNNVGDIDAANGFVEGYAIVQNRTQLEFGGGICQDSTTMYRAAFWAGLPITERKEHRFYISWYDKYAYPDGVSGPGMDATIFTGVQDLKFVNDTGNWLLIETSADHGRTLAEVRIYGTKPNRTVEASWQVVKRVPAPTAPRYIPDRAIPPGGRKQTDTARGGMTIEVYRTITENGVARKPELFRTVFQAWPNIYLINPGDLGPNGQPIPRPDPAQPPADGTVPPPADGTVPPPADGTQPPPPAEQPAPPVEQPQPPAEQPAPVLEQQPQPNG